MSAFAFLRTLRARDAARPSFPGEHLATATAGTWLLGRAARIRSPLWRLAFYAGGAVLMLRAVSGRDGLRRFSRR